MRHVNTVFVVLGMIFMVSATVSVLSLPKQVDPIYTEMAEMNRNLRKYVDTLEKKLNKHRGEFENHKHCRISRGVILNEEE